METNRSLRPRRSLAAGLAVVALLGMSGICIPGCALIERTEPESSEDDEKTPEPFDRWLAVESIAPDSDSISTRPTLEIQFNDHLDDDSFPTYSAGRLSSNGLSWGGWADYVVTDKTLVWTARSNIPDGLEVAFGATDGLQSVNGAPIRKTDKLATFTTDADVDPSRSMEMEDVRNQPTESPDWNDVSAIFEEDCNHCHGQEKWEGLVALEHSEIVGRPSDQVDRLLVRPYDAADSYLMQKLLSDYPLLRYEPQPPPWSDTEPLDRREKLVIERWIDAGAPR